MSDRTSDPPRINISERDPLTGRIVKGSASTFNDEQAQRALFAASQGGTLALCARAAGIPEDRLHTWMQQVPEFGEAMRERWRTSRPGPETANFGGMAAMKIKQQRAYTDAMGETIVQALALGMSLSATAGLVRINHSTLGEWLNPDSEKFNDELHERVEEARAQAVALRLARIQQTGEKGNWTADAWWLERTRPAEFALRRDRWDPPAPTTVTVNITNEIQDAAAAKLEAFRREQQQKMLDMQEGPDGWQLPPPSQP